MRKLALLIALVLAPAASAGGFATVGLSPLPTGAEAGATWSVELTIKAHGRTPADGLAPLVRIRKGGDVREFPAAPTGETGVYRADVVFPTAGTWTYEVWDGYTQTHTYEPVVIGSPGGGGGFPTFALAGGLAVALGAAGAAYLLLRRRPEQPRLGLAKS